MDYRSLNSKLTREIRNLGNAALYVNFIDGDEKVLVNADRQFWAASVIKILIVITLYRLYEDKKIKDLQKRINIKKENLVEGSGIVRLLNNENKYTIEDLAKLTIMLSDNSATNELIDIVTEEGINKTIDELGLENTTFKHKLFIEAGKGPNLTTAEDMGTALEYIFDEKLKNTEQILEILNETKDRTRIPLYIPNNIKISHKTGTLKEAVHDVGIVYSNKPFVFAFLSDDQTIRKIAAEKCGELAKMCFDYSQQ